MFPQRPMPGAPAAPMAPRPAAPMLPPAVPGGGQQAQRIAVTPVPGEAQKLTPQEWQELDSMITPRFVFLIGKLYPAAGQLLAPFVKNDGQAEGATDQNGQPQQPATGQNNIPGAPQGPAAAPQAPMSPLRNFTA